MKKILIVDDDKSQTFALQQYFREYHADKYMVFTAGNGEDCLKLLETEKDIPDLIILDVMMPGMDGFELLSEIRSDRSYDKVPVIFLTAIDDEMEKMLGHEIGDDFIEKPVKMEKLLSKIQEIIDH